MMRDLLDPAIATAREQIDYAPRPPSAQGLRVGLIDNTRKNADQVLHALAAHLAAEQCVTGAALHKLGRSR